ncbi:MAG: hypothetical protein RLZ94_571 [Actinomycetota bacterium]
MRAFGYGSPLAGASRLCMSFGRAVAAIATLWIFAASAPAQNVVVGLGGFLQEPTDAEDFGLRRFPAGGVTLTKAIACIAVRNEDAEAGAGAASWGDPKGIDACRRAMELSAKVHLERVADTEKSGSAARIGDPFEALQVVIDDAAQAFRLSDGKAMAVLVGRHFGFTWHLFDADGSRELGAGVEVPDWAISGPAEVQVYSGDVDRNGSADLIWAAHPRGSKCGATVVALLTGLADGSWSCRVVGKNLLSCVVLDVEGNGRAELLTDSPCRVERCLDGRPHSFHRYDLVGFEDGQLVDLNRTVKGFPKLAWMSFDPADRFRKKLSDQAEWELWQELALPPLRRRGGGLDPVARSAADRTEAAKRRQAWWDGVNNAHERGLGAGAPAGSLEFVERGGQHVITDARGTDRALQACRFMADHPGVGLVRPGRTGSAPDAVASIGPGYRESESTRFEWCDWFIDAYQLDVGANRWFVMASKLDEASAMLVDLRQPNAAPALVRQSWQWSDRRPTQPDLELCRRDLDGDGCQDAILVRCDRGAMRPATWTVSGTVLMFDRQGRCQTSTFRGNDWRLVDLDHNGRMELEFDEHAVVSVRGFKAPAEVLATRLLGFQHGRLVDLSHLHRRGNGSSYPVIELAGFSSAFANADLELAGGLEAHPPLRETLELTPYPVWVRQEPSKRAAPAR